MKSARDVSYSCDSCLGTPQDHLQIGISASFWSTEIKAPTSRCFELDFQHFTSLRLGSEELFAHQYLKQQSFLKKLGLATLAYDSLGCGASRAPWPRDKPSLIECYSPASQYADLEAILQLYNKV